MTFIFNKQSAYNIEVVLGYTCGFVLFFYQKLYLFSCVTGIICVFVCPQFQLQMFDIVCSTSWASRDKCCELPGLVRIELLCLSATLKPSITASNPPPNKKMLSFYFTDSLKTNPSSSHVSNIKKICKPSNWQ